MNKHTPGPWSATGALVTAQGIAVALVILPSDTLDQQIADADLIAAAPDLLAALEMALVECSALTSTEGYPAMKAAIAKARGQG